MTLVKRRDSALNSSVEDSEVQRCDSLRVHCAMFHSQLPVASPASHNFPNCDKSWTVKKSKGSPYSITERRVPRLIPVLGSQPAGDVSYKPGGRLPLLSTQLTQLPSQPLRGLLPILLLGEQRHNGCEQFA